MSLTVEDVQHWDPGAVRAVGDAARRRAQTSIDVANTLPKFPGWTGPGSEEAKQALEKSRQALMRDADAALAAARSAEAAAVNVQIVKDNLQQVLDMARLRLRGRSGGGHGASRAAVDGPTERLAQRGGVAAGVTTGSGPSE